MTVPPSSETPTGRARHRRAHAAVPAELPEAPQPIDLAFPNREKQRRWTVLIRWILCLPLAVVVFVIGIAAELVAIIGWVAALGTGRAPAFVRQLVTIYLRLSLRLYAYNFLLTDRFPAFDFAGVPDDRTHISVPPATRLHRGAVFFRLILVLPAVLLSELLFGGLQLMSVLMWLVVLIAGRLPRSFHQAFAAGIRYQIRIYGYFLLAVPTYPSDLFGDEAFPFEPDVDGSPASAAEPAAEATPDPAAEPTEPWVLTLGPGAKWVLAVAIALGVLVIAGSAAVETAVSVSRVHYQDTIANANNALVDQFDAYDSRSAACEKVANPYRCIEAADAALVPHLHTYASVLQRTTGSGISTSSLAQARMDALLAARTFQMVGRAPPTKVGYTVTEDRSGLAEIVSRLQTSVNRVATELNDANHTF
jgi:Domain of unknown function (DUF4389)